MRIVNEDEALAGRLRELDPLPSRDDLEAELRTALPRTRTGLARVRAAAAAIEPSGPVAAFATYEAPWGMVHLAAADGGLAAIELRATTHGFVETVAARLGGAVVPDQPGLPESWRATLREALRELDEYFAGRRHAFDLPVDLRGVSAWDRQVLAAAAGLGFGQVTSYGGLARRVGKPRAARAVGGALGRNPIPIVIPCHRIVAADGTIGGYGGGGHGSRTAMLEVKRTLLGIEGVALPVVPAA